MLRLFISTRMIAGASRHKLLLTFLITSLVAVADRHTKGAFLMNALNWPSCPYASLNAASLPVDNPLKKI